MGEYYSPSGGNYSAVTLAQYCARTKRAIAMAIHPYGMLDMYRHAIEAAMSMEDFIATVTAREFVEVVKEGGVVGTDFWAKHGASLCRSLCRQISDTGSVKYNLADLMAMADVHNALTLAAFIGDLTRTPVPGDSDDDSDSDDVPDSDGGPAPAPGSHTTDKLSKLSSCVVREYEEIFAAANKHEVTYGKTEVRPGGGPLRPRADRRAASESGVAPRVARRVSGVPPRVPSAPVFSRGKH